VAGYLRCLVQAKEKITVSRGTVERRVVRLVNPGLPETQMTSHTIVLSFQLIQPGEVAPAHRHTMSAFRFILQGRGAYNNVDGQKMIMEEEDLILTPQGSWHEHVHDGDENMIWIDGLDVRSFKRCRPDPQAYYGLARPVGETETNPPLLHYHWRDTYQSLQRLARTTTDPFDSVAMEYVNPATGGSTLPTMPSQVQNAATGRKDQSSPPHEHEHLPCFPRQRHDRHRRRTVSLGKGRKFVVPLWSWHEHASRSATEEAILISMHDSPILRAFGLYREEAHGYSSQKI
jgi:gentisate 1,2-dioxygenase